jgi:hypothetical protein
VGFRAGETREVQFYLMIESKSGGRSAKTILFKTNDPVKSSWPIVVEYMVKRSYRVVAFPAKLDFGRIDPDREVRSTLTLISPYPEPIEVNSITCTEPSIRIQPIGSDALGDALYYSVELPSGYEPGPVGAQIDIETTLGPVRVPIAGRKVGKIECTPTKILFPPVGKNECVEVCLTVSSAAGEDFRVLGATTETHDIQVDLVGDPERPSATHKLRLKLSAPNRLQGVGQSQIRLDTDTLGSQRVDCSYFVRQ